MAAPTISLAVLGAVLLACVQGGWCAAPHPAARARAEHESSVQQQQAYDAWRTAAHQVPVSRVVARREADWHVRPWPPYPPLPGPPLPSVSGAAGLSMSLFFSRRSE
jgi:hypothetical protein